MQGTRVYSAPSLAAVIKHLWLYRASGMLSIRPAAGVLREQAHLTIEYGYPVRIRWGMYEGDANESTLRQLYTWGEIHFMFQSRVRLLSLPSALQPSQQAQSRLSSHPIKSPQVLPNSSKQQPLSSLPISTDKLPPVSQQTHAARTLKPANGTNPSGHGTLYTVAPETVIPALTPNARQNTVTNLSHHDRAIFLLIDGQRTVAELIALTKRSPADVYNTLYSLRDQQLIVMQKILPEHK